MIDLVVPLITLILGIITIWHLSATSRRGTVKEEGIQRISELIQRGTITYLNRQFKTTFLFIPFLTAIIFIVFRHGKQDEKI